MTAPLHDTDGAAPAATSPVAATPGPAPAPGVPPALSPGWTTTEFWSTTAAHVVAALAVVLALTGRSGRALTVAEAAVPLAALLASAVAQRLYANNRNRLKLAHLMTRATALRIDLSKVAAVLTPLAEAGRPLVSITVPKPYAAVSAALAAGHAAATRAEA